jgi:hypothetical protein
MPNFINLLGNSDIAWELNYLTPYSLLDKLERVFHLRKCNSNSDAAKLQLQAQESLQGGSATLNSKGFSSWICEIPLLFHGTY